MIEIVEDCVRQLLHDEVINNTFQVMTALRTNLALLAGRAGDLSRADKTRLMACLEPLISESIREALHKHELPLTNEIIRHKNTILRACNYPHLDEQHAEIVSANYAWNW